MTHCEGLGGNRPTVRVRRYIHDHGDGKESFAWEYGHQGKRRTIKIVSLRGQSLKAPLTQSFAKIILTPLHARDAVNKKDGAAVDFIVFRNF